MGSRQSLIPMDIIRDDVTAEANHDISKSMEQSLGMFPLSNRSSMLTDPNRPNSARDNAPPPPTITSIQSSDAHPTGTSTTTTVPSGTTLTTNTGDTQDRRGSLHTIQSNEGTIGTMDVTEMQRNIISDAVAKYNSSSNAGDSKIINIRPHITSKRSKSNMSGRKSAMQQHDESKEDQSDDDDNVSEIPDIPQSVRHIITIDPAVDPQLEPVPSAGPDPKERRSRSRHGIQLSVASSRVTLTPSEQHIVDAYNHSQQIDLDNMQFDEEVDLNTETGYGGIHSQQPSQGSVEPHDRLQPLKQDVPRLPGRTSKNTNRSVGFQENRNTFMTASTPTASVHAKSVADAEHKGQSRPQLQSHEAGISHGQMSRNTRESEDDRNAYQYHQSNNHFPELIHNRKSPMRFRGPARIALVNKYIAMDPFEGDTEIHQWSIGDVKVWVSSLGGGVNVYADKFMSNHIKGQDLLRLTDSDLLHCIGIKSVGHRQIIMHEVEQLKRCVIVEVNGDRFLVPPHGAVLRFEDVSVQEMRTNTTSSSSSSSPSPELHTILGHATGTFLPNQITAIMGDEQKSLLLKVLCGAKLENKHRVTGHIFINGTAIDGSLLTAGLATYINGDDSYSNFERTTVSDLVAFYVELSGSRHHANAMEFSPQQLVDQILRISDISYPHKTTISDLKPVQYKRLRIAVDTILFDIKLVFLDHILDGLTNVESQQMMQMIYSFSRKLDVTFIISVQRIRYHVLNAYFDQVIVVGGVDANQIRNDCNAYYKALEEEYQSPEHRSSASNENADENENDDTIFEANYARNWRDHRHLHTDLSQSATSIRFVGRPEDVMEYFRLIQVEFERTENPIEVIYEHVKHNQDLIKDELEGDYFRYRKKASSLSPFSHRNGPRLGRMQEIWTLTRFMLVTGWREWSLLFSCLRTICYCFIVGALFWDVSCERYFLNERLLAIFVISCIPMASVYPMLDFQRRHRLFWFHHILMPQRVRVSCLVMALVTLCCTHAAIIGVFSFIPWIMEDLGRNDVTAFVRIGCMQFATGLVYALIALFGAEMYAMNGMRVVSLLCTGTVLFAGALVHAGHVSERPGTIFIEFDFLRYALEFLLFTDVDYIQVDACSDYLQSLEERLYFDRELVDIAMVSMWIGILLFAFTFTINYQLSQSTAYNSQLTVGRMSSKRQADELEIPSLPPTPPLNPINIQASNVMRSQGTRSGDFGRPTPVGYHGTNTSESLTVPRLPLSMYPTDTSMGTGAFKRLHAGNTGTNTPMTPATPMQITGHLGRRSNVRDPSYKYSELTNLIKHSSQPSDNLLPPQDPVLQHQRADSNNKEVVGQNRKKSSSRGIGLTGNVSLESRFSDPHHLGARPHSHSQHEVSLSGLETIHEKKEEAELPANGTNDAALLDPTDRRPVLIHKVPSVKQVSQRTSHTSNPHSSHFTNDSSRYSDITTFLPLRQQSLLHRSSGGPRRSSVNMRSQMVPRYLAISPVHSQHTKESGIHSLTSPVTPIGKGTYSQKRKTGHSPAPALDAVGQISFDGGTQIAMAFATQTRNRMGTIQSQETVTPSPEPNIQSNPNLNTIVYSNATMNGNGNNNSNINDNMTTSPMPTTLPQKMVIDDYNDPEYDQRMRSSSLMFYDLTVVDPTKRVLFNKLNGHVIQRGVTFILAPSNVDTQPLLRAIAGIHCPDVLYMEGQIVVKGKQLLTECKLAQKRIIAFVPKQPILPDLITVQELIRLAFILTEPDVESDAFDQRPADETENVRTILHTMELTAVKHHLVSQLSRLNYLKVAIAYCGLRSKAGIVLIENIYPEFNIIEQKQLLRCIHRLSQVHNLAVLSCIHELTKESIQQDHVNHIIVLSSSVPGGATPIFEGSIPQALHDISKLFAFKQFENVIDQLLDIAARNDNNSIHKLVALSHDLRHFNVLEAQRTVRNCMEMDDYKTASKKWLEYWWLGWLYWRYVYNNPRMFCWVVLKLFIHVLVICMAFWNLPSTHSGSKSMFGAMNALLFIFVLQTPANHRLFLPLLRLGIQDWNGGKYSLNMMSTLHCWAQYLLSIVLGTITSLLSYWMVNFNDPATALGYSIVLFTMGFVYSAGVWDSIYFLLFALGCDQNLSFFIMAHLLLYFWLFSGCFILKSSMPAIMRYVGYYANPVRLTLESQYCAIILPKTFGNERGSDILAESDYDCAIGFDLSLVFLITFVLRIVGSLVLAYRYESSPLYNERISRLMANPNDYGRYDLQHDDDEDDDDDDDDDGGDEPVPNEHRNGRNAANDHHDNLHIVIGNMPSNGSGRGIDADDEDDDDDDDESGGYPLTQNLARSSKDGDSQLLTPPSTITVSAGTQPSRQSKRMSRHKGHSSIDHIPNLGNIQVHTPPSDYLQLEDENENENQRRNEAEDGKKREEALGMMKGVKEFIASKFTKKEEKGMESKKVGLLQHIHLDDMTRIEDETDSDTAHLDEFAAFQTHTGDVADDGGRRRVKYGNEHDNYSAMILGTGDDDDNIGQL